VLPARTPADDRPHPHESGHGITRGRVLDAAEELFAEHGYAATSVRDITAAAGCNLAAVNYHFGSKRNLYREVFLRHLSALREQRLAALAAPTGGTTDGRNLARVLKGFAEAFLAPLREESDGRIPLRLMMREIVDPYLPRDLFQSELFAPVSQALVRAMSHAAPEVPERIVLLCAQSFVAQLLHVINAQRRWATQGERPLGTFTLAELEDHIVRFTLAGIEHLRETHT
jgi:AcrR family transcriptional regulator